MIDFNSYTIILNQTMKSLEHDRKENLPGSKAFLHQISSE
jgi:hypothetical protein